MAKWAFFSDSEMKSRTAKLREKMREIGVECAIAMDMAHSFYFSGSGSCNHHGGGRGIGRRPQPTLIPLDGNPAMIISRVDVHHAKTTSWIKDIKVYDDTCPPIESMMMLVKEFLVERGLKSPAIGIIEPSIPVTIYRRLKKELPDAEFVDVSDTVQRLMVVKSDEEIKLMRQGFEMCDFACGALLNAAKEGMSELEIVTEVCRATATEITKRYPDNYEVNPKLCGGTTGPEKTLDPHSFPTLKKLEKGDLFYMYSLVEINGYFTHIHRMASLGKPSDEIRKISEVVSEAFERGCQMVRPGVTYGDIDMATREIIMKAGYGKYIVHGSGHALGVMGAMGAMQELRIYNKTKLQERHIMCVEPGIYKPGIGGWMQSDQFLVTKTGSERLTKHPLGTNII